MSYWKRPAWAFILLWCLLSDSAEVTWLTLIVLFVFGVLMGCLASDLYVNFKIKQDCRRSIAEYEYRRKRGLDHF